MGFAADMASALFAALSGVAPTPIVYQREGVSSPAELTAILSHLTARASVQPGIVEGYEHWDFILTASDLVLDGEVATPQIGDTIVLADSDGRTFVVSPNPIELNFKYSHYNYVDSERTILRVHAKLQEAV